MIFQKKEIDWKWYGEEVRELERLQHNIAFLKPVKIKPELVNQVYTSCYKIATSEKPILATERIFSCVSVLAYDLSGQYAFLAHSYGNENYGIDNSTSPSQIYDGWHYIPPKDVILGSSIHVIDMLNTLSKDELYKLRFDIIVGSKPNIRLISSMINTIISLREKNISVESIELTKPFIRRIHTDNDINHGKNKNYYDLEMKYMGKKREIVENEITGEIHSYSRTRGSSFAFDSRDGRMFTYNSDTKQYYSYDSSPSVEIKIR